MFGGATYVVVRSLCYVPIPSGKLYIPLIVRPYNDIVNNSDIVKCFFITINGLSPYSQTTDSIIPHLPGEGC